MASARYALFREADKDNSGEITFDEMQLVLRSPLKGRTFHDLPCPSTDLPLTFLPLIFHWPSTDLPPTDG